MISSHIEKDLHGFLAMGLLEREVLGIPLRHVVQIACVSLWLATSPATGAMWGVLFAYLAFRCPIPYFWVIFVIYTLWGLFWDRRPHHGGSPMPGMRESSFWTWCAEYFPIKIHRTVPLDPSKSYLFGYHPHGVLGTGAFLTFLTNASGFARLFPGVDVRLATLNLCFFAPVVRELMIAYGLVSCSASSLKACLSHRRGQSVAVVVGGAAEALESHPGTYNVVLKRRRGFIRLALSAGASVVPTFAFGETDLYDCLPNPPGSLLRRAQRVCQSLFAYSIPIFRGRGWFRISVGMLPYRAPLNVIVGAPIDLPHIPNPTPDEVATWHAKYLDALQDLFATHAATHAPKRTSDLVFVD